MPVGCYKNIGREFDEILAKVGIKPSIKSRYSTCVDAADKAGVKVFGLDDKRCWTGDGSYSKYGSSDQCQKAKKGDLHMGLKDKGTMYVYSKDRKGKMSLFFQIQSYTSLNYPSDNERQAVFFFLF